MSKIVNYILIIAIGSMFVLNSDICNYFHDPSFVDPVTGESPWWNLRFKLYSCLFTMLGLTIFLNTKGKIKITMVPVLAIFLGDFKDRVFFEYTDRDWSDWFLLGISILTILIIWQHDKSRRRRLENNPKLDNPDFSRNDGS